MKISVSLIIYSFSTFLKSIQYILIDGRFIIIRYRCRAFKRFRHRNRSPHSRNLRKNVIFPDSGYDDPVVIFLGILILILNEMKRKKGIIVECLEIFTVGCRNVTVATHLVCLPIAVLDIVVKKILLDSST